MANSNTNNISQSPTTNLPQFPQSSSGIYLSYHGVGGGGSGGGGGSAGYSNVSGGYTSITRLPTVEISGDCSITGNLEVGGRNMEEWMAKIESNLGMLHINQELEMEFGELKRLGDEYREAERRFIEQKRIYNILNKPV